MLAGYNAHMESYNSIETGYGVLILRAAMCHLRDQGLAINDDAVDELRWRMVLIGAEIL
jgi:hypothetical protein